jgi:UPF0271 protein
MKRIDLNVDIGEGFPFDEELMEFATSGNIGCAAHAGNWDLTIETISLCRKYGLRVGMHPGFPDRKNMGRVIPDEWRADWAKSLLDQADRFMAVARAAYIKPHGAWYNGLAASKPLFKDELIQIVDKFRLPCMALPGTSICDELGDMGIREGFADRGYRSDGTLIPRTEPGAILHEPAEIAAQVLALAARVDSICLHGDTPGCLEFAELVTKTLEDNGFEVGS